MVEIALGPLTETLVVTILSLIGILNLIQLITLKKVSEYEILKILPTLKHKELEIFNHHERGICYYITLYGFTILCPVTFSILFISIYETLSELDSGPYILALVVVYWLLMILWFLAQYVWTTKKTGFSILFAILSILTAVATLVLNIITLDEHKWETYFPINLLVVSVFAIFASNSSNTYRHEQLYDSNSSSSSSSPITFR